MAGHSVLDAAGLDHDDVDREWLARTARLISGHIV
jgi:hypothetical protein